MSDVVNLRHFRKRKSREDAARRADENRIVHGETKGGRQLRETEAENSIRIFEAHRRDTADDAD